MDELLTFGIIFCFVWVVGSILLGLWDQHRTAKEELRDQIYRKLDEIIHRVKVEEHHGHLYWFDEDDDEFLAQGETQQDIINILKKRFPKHIFFVDADQVISQSTDWQISNQSKVTVNDIKLFE